MNPAHDPAAAGKGCIAFAGGCAVARGTTAQVLAQLQADGHCDARGMALGKTSGPLLVFDETTGEPIELSACAPLADGGVRGSAGVPSHDTTIRPGRPKLGVVAREVTLLPQDWAWLAAQPGGASVTLRKLVLRARRFNESADRQRQSQVSCYRFITAVAGNLPGYEEANRALFAHQAERFQAHTLGWPDDVRAFAWKLAREAFAPPPGAQAP